MALRLVIAPAAERDLADILEFISQDNVSAARKTVLRIEWAIGRLLERLFLGPAVVRPKRIGFRKMTVSPYIVFYRLADDQLQVVRLLHSSRDLDEELPVD
jgi:toxin ParE1/3/4